MTHWCGCGIFGGLFGGGCGLPFDHIGQGMAQQSAANAQAAMMGNILPVGAPRDPDGLYNAFRTAYVPPAPIPGESALREEVEGIHRALGRIDWIWWGWFAAMGTGMLLRWWFR